MQLSMKCLAQICIAAAALVAPAASGPAGLEVELWLRGGDPKSVTRLGALSDAVLMPRFKNHSSAPLTLAVDDALCRFMALPLLATLGVKREDGAPVALPAFRVGTNFGVSGSGGELLFQVPMRWLPAEGSFDWTIPVVEWPGWQSMELAPGRYRMRFVYHGPPDQTGVQYADPGAIAAWRGSAASAECTIEITGSETALTFGAVQSGLRVAARPDPRGDRFLQDDPIAMQFVVENVTDAPIDLTREVGGSEEDEIAIVDVGGREILDCATMHSGWSPVVKLTLPAHARVRLFAGAARFGIEGVSIGNRSGPAAPAGRYRIRHRLSVTIGNTEPVNHVVPSRSQLAVPERELEILARR